MNTVFSRTSSFATSIRIACQRLIMALISFLDASRKAHQKKNVVISPLFSRAFLSPCCRTRPSILVRLYIRRHRRALPFPLILFQCPWFVVLHRMTKSNCRTNPWSYYANISGISLSLLLDQSPYALDNNHGNLGTHSNSRVTTGVVWRNIGPNSLLIRLR